MTVIEMARELGKKIQQEESYILLNTAQKAVEDDDELQEKIAEYNKSTGEERFIISNFRTSTTTLI